MDDLRRDCLGCKLCRIASDLHAARRHPARAAWPSTCSNSGTPLKLPPAPTYDFCHNTGRVRTHLFCHECDGNFIAVIDYDLEGNHVVHCAHCGHEHCRVVRDGRVTAERWDSRLGRVDMTEVRKIQVESQIYTNSNSGFIRDAWLRSGR